MKTPLAPSEAFCSANIDRPALSASAELSARAAMPWVADYCGRQEGIADLPAFNLWTLRLPVGPHCAGTTVAESTLLAALAGLSDDERGAVCFRGRCALPTPAEAGIRKADVPHMPSWRALRAVHAITAEQAKRRDYNAPPLTVEEQAAMIDEAMRD